MGVEYMAEFNTVVTNTLISSAWANAILDHAFEKPCSFIVRKKDSYYEAINGSTGKIDYGGSGNAGGVSGTNASAVIQATINALTSRGKIFIKAGVYVITSPIIIKSDIEIFGECAATYLMAGGANLDIISNSSQCVRVNLHDFLIDGQLYNNINAINAILAASKIFFLHIMDCTGSGIQLKSAGSSWGSRSFETDILFNRIINCRTAGINLPQYSSDNIIFGNLIDGASSAEPTIRSTCGISINHGNFVAYNHLYDNKNNIIVSAPNVRLVDNYFDSSQEHGVILSSDSAIIGAIHIVNNRFLKQGILGGNNNLYSSIYLSGTNAITNVEIIGNYFQCEETDKPKHHIEENRIILNSNYVLNNFIQDSTGSGPILKNSSSTTRIFNNIGYVTENSETAIGTGAQQIIAHGCAFTPTDANVVLSNIDDGANPYISGTPNATNIYVTAVNTKKYRWEVKS